MLGNAPNAIKAKMPLPTFTCIKVSREGNVKHVRLNGISITKGKIANGRLGMNPIGLI